ncbi:hypothetical protein MHBO_003304 [Bonamia ostreae]|uniref:Uncharacterized protein n=1 Tax=Bonamia ostreae TaxID=126728 RepID=A0ABV2AQS9_9EUKA
MTLILKLLFLFQILSAKCLFPLKRKDIEINQENLNLNDKIITIRQNCPENAIFANLATMEQFNSITMVCLPFFDEFVWLQDNLTKIDQFECFKNYPEFESISFASILFLFFCSVLAFYAILAVVSINCKRKVKITSKDSLYFDNPNYEYEE